MCYLLVDTEETGIEAEITKADQSLLPVKPDDGNIYLFRQFRVETPNNGYNATGHNFIMRMTKWIEALRINNLAVQPPLFYFNFKEFEDIGTTIRGSRVVVDVIGRISSIGPVEQINTQSGLTDIRDILIENIRYTTHYYEKFPNMLSLIVEVSLILRVTDGETTAKFTLIEKPAENIINKKVDMVFAESRRIGKMVPPSLENIYGKRFCLSSRSTYLSYINNV
ncbi:hypothetical protein FCM35_KLT07963 [Carex littledalei]|uniref:Uncharacterized protein n=1 Tax=Carex littledalei TaxID=544730 RepID=A0A833QWM2_9POAL|nr:hypothetical protein FCM35_KLT07963 [Carex littledalei]